MKEELERLRAQMTDDTGRKKFEPPDYDRTSDASGKRFLTVGQSALCGLVRFFVAV